MFLDSLSCHCQYFFIILSSFSGLRIKETKEVYEGEVNNLFLLFV